MESLLSAVIVLLLVSFSCFTSSEALTSNNGNITIKWDIMSWTPDGYGALVTAYNYQNHRSIPSPGWKMSWRWTKKVIDSLPGVPYTQQIANCCRGGVLKPGSESAFLISVGKGGNSVQTVRMPANFLFTAPKQQYVCGPTKNVRPTVFMSPDTKRSTSAFMTWKIVCVFNKAT
ncbi:hypothetical protein Bca52824_055535 [Brassica carinata]|uniref:COBRA-like protein n=1 Tax=Brassica carinata TaxID=52824 RepID=A0A8X7R9I9_BRACI|nr:hypothetical protein Bca52824_055535 [Brassica carinata]